MSDFRKIKWDSPPVRQWWKNWHNFFFYWSDIAEKNFGEPKVFTLSVFQKKIDFVCLPRF
jgi:hypothetical protein